VKGRFFPFLSLFGKRQTEDNDSLFSKDVYNLCVCVEKNNNTFLTTKEEEEDEKKKCGGPRRFLIKIF
jgi:hypothetical protein